MFFGVYIRYEELGFSMNIYTIGYEGLSSENFFGLLRENAVDLLIDIRDLPLSRKKGFSKNALASNSRLNGIDYLHVQALGCPKEIRHQYRADKNWLNYSIRFFDYLRTQKEALVSVSKLVSEKTICLMCFEKDFLFCHRSYVSLVLEEYYVNDARIIDLRSDCSAMMAGKCSEDIRARLSTIHADVRELYPL